VPKDMGEAAAHEAGHTWGLTHQGTGNAPVSSPDNSIAGTYYSGNGLWGPIMGDPYNMPITQWARGEYPNANNKQDELAVMRAHGLTLKADDGPATYGSARPLPASRTGVITSASDVDWFDLGTCAKGTAITVSPGASSDLDAVMVLRNASTGATVTTNPAAAKSSTTAASGLNASYTPTTAVHYLIGVHGTGYKTPTTGGYSAYGSIGSYTIGAGGCKPPAARSPGPPQVVYGAMPVHGGATAISWAAPVYDGGAAITGYQIAVDGGAATSLGASARAATVSLSDKDHKVTVWAVNSKGRGAAATYTVRAARKPGAVQALHVASNPAQHRLTLTWSPPAGLTTAVTRYEIAVNGKTLSTHAHSGAWLSDIEAGYVYRVSVRAIDALGAGPYRTVPFVIKTKPGRMYLHRLTAGAAGGPSTVKVKWWPLRQTGDYKLTKYRIFAYKHPHGHRGHVYEKTIKARKKKAVLTLPHGYYYIAMKAKNSHGWGPLSKRLGAVLAR